MKDDRKVIVIMHKNILLLGNGFDLANRLPTTYRDFLEFCEKISVIYTEHDLITFQDEYYTRYLKNWRFDEFTKNKLNETFRGRKYVGTTIRTHDQYLDKLFDCIHKNLLYRYFKVAIPHKTKIGQNWIDFESE
ncbi:MAG: bacteriophage abortive infection AbiH family protein, partial [Oscillospiraceae bacterium]|nr:bacteriophage abortive infection AbiH family protein [Oscillospiraceae bacterium]